MTGRAFFFFLMENLSLLFAQLNSPRTYGFQSRSLSGPSRSALHFAYPGDAIARRGGSFDRTRKHDERHRRSPLAHRRAPRARDPQGRRQGPRGTSRSSRPRRRTLANRATVANLPRVARVCRVRALAAPSRRAHMPRPPWRSRNSHGAIPPSPPAISPRNAGPLHRHGPEAGASRSRDPRPPAHARPATAWQSRHSRPPECRLLPAFPVKVFPTPRASFLGSQKRHPLTFSALLLRTRLVRVRLRSRRRPPRRFPSSSSLRPPRLSRSRPPTPRTRATCSAPSTPAWWAT